MILAGFYTRGTTFKFRITSSKLRVSYMLLADDESKKGQIKSVQILDVTGQDKFIPQNTIMAHVISSVGGNIQYLYGYSELIRAFINDCNNSGIINKYLDNEDGFATDEIKIFEDYEVSVNNAIIDLVYLKNTSQSVRKLSKLEYTDYRTETDTIADKMTVTLRAGKVRNLEQLKKIYDLSWILDENGNMKRDYKSVRTQEDLQEVIDGIKSHDIISFDFETTGLEFYHYMKDLPEDQQPKIVGMGISWKEGMARYIPLISNKFECLDYQSTVDTILSLLTTKKLIGANLLFDFGVSYYHGYLQTCHYDVMQAEFDIDPTGSRGKKKLKEITRNYAGWETLELDEVLGGDVDGRLISELDEEVILIYGGADVDTVWTVMKAQQPYLKGKEVIWNIDMHMIPIIAVEDYYGCKMDMNVWEILNDINKVDKQNVENTIWAYLEEKASWKYTRQLYRQMYDRELSDNEVIELLQSRPEIKFESRKILMKKVKKEDTMLQLGSIKDLIFIMSEILEYPVEPDFAGKISLNDEYLHQLSIIKTSNPESFLKEDLMSHSCDFDIDWVQNLPADEKIILSKSELEKSAYPFAIMLREWRKLEKRDNSFLTPISKIAVNGWYNRNTSMTAADTARFINPTQTLQGYMKKLDIAYDSSRYFVQFDLAQIEFRVMIGNAVRAWNKFISNLPEDKEFDILRTKDISYLIDKLNIPWTDYHREGGSVLVGTTPAKMTKKERSKVKPTHFAVPYGAEAYTVAKPKLIETTSEIEKRRILQETEETLMVWKRTMFPLHKYLETKRDLALIPLPDDQLPPNLKGGKYGKVTNSLGRCRYYNLDYKAITDNRLYKDGKWELILDDNSSEYKEELAKQTRRVKASIRRSAGNYPIQSDAREYFALIMIKLFDYCKKHGLSGTGNYNTDKIIQSLMIHDENHLQVSKDIHPFKIYQILLENCLLHINGYPYFYMGIAVCDSWYESKDDKFEAPVEFVMDIVKEYKANPNKFENENWKASPKEYVLGYISRWIDKKCDEFVMGYVKDGVFDVERFRKVNENYFFLIKPVLYTEKFLNEETDLTKEELVLLYHCKDKNVIVRTKTREFKLSDYVWEHPKTVEKKNKVTTNNNKQIENTETSLFNDNVQASNNDLSSGNDLYDSLFDDIESANESTEDDFGVVIDNSLFTDSIMTDTFEMSDFSELFDEDVTAMKDNEADKCYWLYSEAERTFNTSAEIDSGIAETVSEEKLVDEDSSFEFSGMACINDMWVMDITKLSKDKFATVVKFLERYKTTSGLPLVLSTNNGVVKTHSRYSRNIDMTTVQLLMTE